MRNVLLTQSISVLLFIGLALLMPPVLLAQQTNLLTITQAYELAKKNYPLIKQRDLIKKAGDYSVENAAKGYLPQVSFSGQATYQSAVTSIPFNVPGFSIPQYSKDQYKLYGEVDQVIYDGGVIKNQKQTAAANEIIQQQNLEVELYALYDRVNELFFGILLADQQLQQTDLLEKDIQNGIDKTNALITNGTAFRSSADELQAQLLETDQNKVEIKALRKSYTDMLGLFINQPGDSIQLEEPQRLVLSDSINRPEIMLYDYQKRTYDLQSDLLKDQLKPKFSFFFQGGYARPGLNELSNDFEWYYIGGLRLNWNLGSLYTYKNQKRVLDINKQTLDIEKETFVFNTQLSQKQENATIVKYQELIGKDDAIISLRNSVKNASYAQLENGVLSAHDYITEVNAEDKARQDRILHQVQLLQASYSYQSISGNQMP
jgi:outer membrane protein TolC